MVFFQQKSLREQLYDYIKEKLNSGELRPGDAINQKQISEALHISKTPFRDCMIQLESEGLVEVIPCKGVVVRKLTYQELLELHQMGGALEGTAYELACDYIDDALLSQLEEIVQNVLGFLEKGDLSFCHEANVRFHAAILACCPNKNLIMAISRLRDRILEFPRRDISKMLKWELLFWGEHQLQLNIIKKGEAKVLGDHMRNVHWSFDGKEDYFKVFFGIHTEWV